MSKDRVSLHLMIDKKDYEIMDAFCTNHGDMSVMVRHVIHTFCNGLRKGDKIELPPEVRHQMADYELEDGDEG